MRQRRRDQHVVDGVRRHGRGEAAAEREGGEAAAREQVDSSEPALSGCVSDGEAGGERHRGGHPAQGDRGDGEGRATPERLLVHRPQCDVAGTRGRAPVDRSPGQPSCEPHEQHEADAATDDHRRPRLTVVGEGQAEQQRHARSGEPQSLSRYEPGPRSGLLRPAEWDDVEHSLVQPVDLEQVVRLAIEEAAERERSPARARSRRGGCSARRGPLRAARSGSRAART